MDKRLDLLDRDEFIENVVKIVNQLSEIERGCCFAIEGGWGVGKTFVIEEIEERLKEISSEGTIRSNPQGITAAQIPPAASAPYSAYESHPSASPFTTLMPLVPNAYPI